MNAYIVFKADLLVNAEIMTDLGTGNAYAEAIANRWNELTPISVYAERSADTYDAPHFFDTLNNRKQLPMTFAAYVTSGQAVKYTRGTPYAVKQVLEDNLLGETTAFSETANKAAPDITLVKLVDNKYVAAAEVMEGQDAVFRCLDTDYLTKLAESGYTVDKENGLLTISKENLTLGDNSITIQVEGYQTVRLSVRYQKVLEEVSLSGPAEGVQLGNPVSITCTTDHGDAACDFLANVTGVTLKRPDETTKELSKDGVESVSDEIGYTVNGDTLTLGKDLFSTAGDYSVTIRAGYGYETQTVNFTITAKEVTPDPEEAVPPTVAGVELVNGYDSFYRVSFSGDAEAYLNKVTGATVDGTACEITSMFLREKQMKIFKDNGVATYIDFTTDCFSASGETTVVIQATGYTDLTFKVKDGKLVTGESEIAVPTTAPSVSKKTDTSSYNQYYELTFPEGYHEWIANISGVSVNGSSYNKKNSTADLSFSGNYCLDADNNKVGISLPSYGDPFEVIFSVKGQPSLTLSISTPMFGNPTAEITN